MLLGGLPTLASILLSSRSRLLARSADTRACSTDALAALRPVLISFRFLRMLNLRKILACSACLVRCQIAEPPVGDFAWIVMRVIVELKPEWTPQEPPPVRL